MNRIFYTLLVTVALLVAGCHSRPQHDPVPDAAPAAYYWRTTFQLTPDERARLADQHIGKLYVRMFDVVHQKQGSRPHATIEFQDSLPSGVEIIPTVYIENGCLSNEAALPDLADKLVHRVCQMCQTHHIPMHELQIDCDWAVSQQSVFTRFIHHIRRHLRQHDASYRLSATIRLHQLSQTPPPVDYGVLMLYNTGNVNNVKSGINPVLSMHDVQPYLSHLSSYALPLCAAYPRFTMPAIYCGGQLKGILYGEDLADTTLYRPIAPNHYRVCKHQVITLHVATGTSTLYLHPGEDVHVWQASPQLIDSVSNAVQDLRPEINDQTIYYPL